MEWRESKSRESQRHTGRRAANRDIRKRFEPARQHGIRQRHKNKLARGDGASWTCPHCMRELNLSQFIAHLAHRKTAGECPEFLEAEAEEG